MKQVLSRSGMEKNQESGGWRLTSERKRRERTRKTQQRRWSSMAVDSPPWQDTGYTLAIAVSTLPQ